MEIIDRAVRLAACELTFTAKGKGTQNAGSANSSELNTVARQIQGKLVSSCPHVSLLEPMQQSTYHAPGRGEFGVRADALLRVKVVGDENEIQKLVNMRYGAFGLKHPEVTGWVQGPEAEALAREHYARAQAEAGAWERQVALIDEAKQNLWRAGRHSTNPQPSLPQEALANPLFEAAADAGSDQTGESAAQIQAAFGVPLAESTGNPYLMGAAQTNEMIQNDE